MTVAPAFGRWDVDDFLSEISDNQYREWLDFHCTVQPLDPTFMIMRGLMGSPKQEQNTGGGWEQSKMNMIKHMNMAKSHGKRKGKSVAANWQWNAIKH